MLNISHPHVRGTPRDARDSARHICQEALVVLTSLRGGPPAVARGELAQDLMEVRLLAKARLETPADGALPVTIKTMRPTVLEQVPETPETLDHSSQLHQQNSEDDDGLEGAVLVQRRDAQAFNPPESPIPTSNICNIATKGTPRIKEVNPDGSRSRMKLSPKNVGPLAHPFLAVVMDPRAAGPHTLVALRALYRLLEQGSLVQPSAASHGFTASFEPLMRGVLACKFEQTDAGADEAVEMAIADLLALLVSLDHRSIPPETLMDAFNTVFVTRNTFVHSPALCYHFEDVLSSMVVPVFGDLETSREDAARLILEFLVNQLLHTPLVGSDVLDESTQEAHMAHDATRVLCLRLVQCCLRTGWGGHPGPDDLPKMPFGTLDEQHSEQEGNQVASSEADSWEERTLLRIIQDDLCLSLLMTGQAIWAYHDASSNISPGVISLEVLSEICATLSTLWNTVVLRRHLVLQFETIFTGFYQRALALLRKRRNPTDSVSFNANLVFDAEVEIILESLVDVLCLHDDQHRISEGEGGALETLFSTYDCHMSRSDVASGLMVELCRCCGGYVGEDGEELSDPISRSSSLGGTSTPNTPIPGGGGNNTSGVSRLMPVEPLRQVPAHLKELCVEALMGAMKCLFRDDHPNAATLAERVRRSTASTTPEEKVSPNSDGDMGESVVNSDKNSVACHPLRSAKSKKRLMRRAAHLFNEKSTKGIQFLVTSGLVPTPVTPASVASFLRNALVVGLDKKAVGAYLGEVGKAPVAGKSPPSWERDWFHKDVLSAYCSLFRFERQTLLDGLRMFLASFRLPGEAQQIDRILQAFAESCGCSCDESSQGRLKLFSPDPKKASDAAYLLSFSIIMLNTDQHNDNIRGDRRMKMEDFVKNNADYGEDITEPGHELPREFLEGVFESIREEELRTEGEGADGHMTVERWKDVLRGPAIDIDGTDTRKDAVATPASDADDVRELVLESLWMPIISAIGSLWGVMRLDEPALEGDARIIAESSHSGMLGAQGARLGMDMALEMLTGVQKLGRMDIFKNIFLTVCEYSGLLSNYNTDAVDRTWSFVNSVESQSAVIVAIQIARDAGADIGVEGWKCVWGMIFELRDLKLLEGGGASKRRGLLVESDPDLLSMDSRREWSMRLIKGGTDGRRESRGAQKKGIFAALFGSQDSSPGHDGIQQGNSSVGGSVNNLILTPHGKEELVVWDELAPSDDEDDLGPNDEDEPDSSDYIMFGNKMVQNPASSYGSVGAAFESQLIHEDILVYHQEVTPITGLERVEDTRQYQISPRARVRKRLARACDFADLVSESRFLDLEGILCLLKTLLGVVQSAPPRANCSNITKSRVPSSHTTFPVSPRPLDQLPISPASEALAEILICEIALKNRDRLGMLWQTLLRDHYARRLGNGALHAARATAVSGNDMTPAPLNPGIEKCVTGLVRICSCAILREEIANDVIASLNVLCPPGGDQVPLSVFHDLRKHLGEGLWRICRNVDGMQYLGVEGWNSLLGLAQWCACTGGDVIHRSAGLSEDDPALQAFRSLHLILHTAELQDVVPFRVVGAVRALIVAGEKRNCPKLSFAGLDLLHLLHTRLEFFVGEVSRKIQNGRMKEKTDDGESEDWNNCWLPLLEGMAEAAEHSRYPSVREHALSLLTDSFIDKHGRSMPPDQLCVVLQRICIPLARTRISSLFQMEEATHRNVEESMTEFELCIGLLFKPFLHHLKNILRGEADILSVWRPILEILQDVFSDGEVGDRHEGAADQETTHKRLRGKIDLKQDKFILSAKELAGEHLRNAVMVLVASGVLKAVPDSPKDISAETWASVGKMHFCKEFVDEWKQSALDPTNVE